MALYCTDGEGWYCKIVDYDAVINELIKADMLKDMYAETKTTYEISKGIKKLLDANIIECVEGNSSDMDILPDVEISVAKFRASVVENYGEDEAKELDEKVQKAFDEAAFNK